MSPLLDQITAELDRLAALEPSRFPFISLYLDLQPDQHGRDHFDTFVRKELGERLRTFEVGGAERASLDADCEKIRRFLGGIDPAANGLALFACSGRDFFEGLQLPAPIAENRLCISDRPHLYPLARLIDEYPRFAVLRADTHVSRIFVVAVNTVEHRRQMEGPKTKRHKMGGWSQARYQRHVENYHRQHVKEVVEALGQIVRADRIASIVIAGDEVVVPMVKAALPKDLADRVVDIIRIDEYASERELLTATIEAMREKDRQTDRERVEALVDAYRAGGLAVAGVEATRRALSQGQVDELLIAASTRTIKPGEDAAARASGPAVAPTPEERVADELVSEARRTGAGVRFIEEPSLMAPIGGAGAFLRFRL